MSAAAFLLFCLFVIGTIVGIYYALICLPVLWQDRHKPKLPYNPEAERLRVDANDNSQPCSVPGGGIPMLVIDPKSQGKRHYPTKEDLESAENVVTTPPAAVGASDKRPLDEPDSHADVPVVVRNQMKAKKDDGDQSECKGLLQGDEEDGLLQQQPPQYLEGSKGVLVCDPDRQSPDDDPKHVIVTIPEPHEVPKEQNIAVEHPVSHPVVSMPQALSVVPMLSVPVYDESPTDEQNPTSLQDCYHTTPTLRVKQEETPYGWSEDVKKVEEVPSTESKPTKNHGSKTSLNKTNESPEKNLGSKISLISANRTDNETDTSDAEITEYTFTETEPTEQCNGKGDLSIVIGGSFSDVRLLSYSNTTDQDTTKLGTNSPDLTRRSPDGLSVKSLDNEISSKQKKPTRTRIETSE